MVTQDVTAEIVDVRPEDSVMGLGISHIYCKRAVKQNLMAYSWKCFLYLYNDYSKPKIEIDNPNDKVRMKLKKYNFLLPCCHYGGMSDRSIKKEKEECLKSLHQRK